MKKIKVAKSIIFILLAIATAAACLLMYTTMKVHIIAAAAATLLLIVFTVLDAKSWKMVTTDILSRLCFLTALVTGVLMNQDIMNTVRVAVIHRTTALLFAALILICFYQNNKEKTNEE